MKPTQIARAGLLGALTLAISATAWAADKTDTRFYVTPMASYGFFDDDVSNQPNPTPDVKVAPDDDMGFTIAVGKVLNKYFNAELFYYNFSGLQDKNIQGAETESEGFGIAGMYFPFRHFIPVYALAGFGSGDFTFSGYGAPDGKADADYFDIGVGIVLPIPYIDFGYGMRLRAEYRLRNLDVELLNARDVEFNNGIASLGLVIPIGAPPAPPEPEPAPAPAPTDSDNDGVMDGSDQCPNTPPGTPVDASGCEKPQDSDNDGVLNDADQCPNTPPGTQVDANGCEVIVLHGVTFHFNQATLTQEAGAYLDKVVQKLESHPSIEVKIVGHTDSKGSAAYNQELSAERAKSVVRYLVEHGIDPSRMTSKGMGESVPVAPNTNPDGSDNPEGRAKNRRVEIHITNR